MRTIELLAPAKNLECGIAAIDHGADAVYIGPQRFGARAAAGNSVEDITTLCQYAHQFGAKVYATVNTIIYDGEMEDVRRLMDELSKGGVDAFLIQDLRLMSDSYNLHASTQTDNRTVKRVRQLRDMGFARVVLARELSLEEIGAIHKAVPDVELEVFVHGALCVSYSGACYASQYCFGRSANRGECAQFCRLKFDLKDADGRVVEHDRHLLSLKDMCRINYLEELLDAGAVSLKIEGRLKDVGYVKNVVAAYSQRLDEIIARQPGRYARASYGRCKYYFTPDLKKTFNRGYTDYFLHGRQNNIASFDTSKAIGQMVGTVKTVERASVIVAGSAAFANGDGLCFMSDQRELVGFRVNRVEGNRLHLLRVPEGLRKGMTLYRNHDEAFSKLLAGKTAVRRIPLTMTIGRNRGGDVVLNGVTASGSQASVVLDMEPQTAQKNQRDNIIRQLQKLGNTPYECDEVRIEDRVDELFIPSSVLADARRTLVEALSTTGIERNNISEEVRGNVADNACEAIENSDHLNVKNPSLLMQCRHCLRYSLGYCVKNGGKRPLWKEPLRLEMGDGRKFRLDFDCKKCQMNVLLFLFACLFILTGCYRERTPSRFQMKDTVIVADTLTKEQQDSLTFAKTHHFSENFNFVVRGDSLMLLRQEPEEWVNGMMTDSFAIAHGERAAVAEIRILPDDPEDSVWIQLATENYTFGWVHEKKMLEKVDPDDPISQFISTFSDVHLLLFLGVFSLIVIAYILRKQLKRNNKIVHYNDIPSPYPMALAINVAVSATFYASIQKFAPEMWREFYFHPSLNPFSQPLFMGLFVGSVWLMLILAIASADESMRYLHFEGAVAYLLNLGAVCALCYIVFSVSTLYYIGYPLLVIYIRWAVKRWRDDGVLSE